MRRRAGLVLCLALAPACAYRYIGRRVDALAQVVDQATRAGAATCAPVELALSRVHLEFARHELADGDAPRAEQHLTLAEPNGQAALRLAKEHKCAAQALEPQGSLLTTPQERTPRLVEHAPHAKRDGTRASKTSAATAQQGVGYEKR
jgi:hypothetical protein